MTTRGTRNGSEYDAIVVGAGPNGFAAAIELARNGRSVLLREAAPEIGGGLRTADGLTRPGFLHDICASVYPLGAGSPYFSRLGLEEHGLEWVHPPAPLAHPFDDGMAALLERATDATGETFGNAHDALAYERLMHPFLEHWAALSGDILAPLHLPRHPVLFARFGLRALQSASGLAKRSFGGERARALFCGICAHAVVPPSYVATTAYGLTLALAGHAVGWPIVRGGSRRLAEALASALRALGGEIVVDAPVRSLDDLPPARTVLLNLTPRQVLQIAGDRLPSRYRRALARFRHGPGVFKIDWALSAPIPWRAPGCARAGTVHLAGTLSEVEAAEEAPWQGEHAERPFVLLGQPSLIDDTRAPAGAHTAWAYCHVPFGSTVDMTERIETQVERFAPGFRDVILARHTMNTVELEAHDMNIVGGDIGAGANVLGQLFFRPMVKRVPYATSIEGVFLCSASTPPGGGVHGMSGYHAARAALRERL
jgi:phytoene dehydrogenase-like protein